jgi:hypothetical protein
MVIHNEGASPGKVENNAKRPMPKSNTFEPPYFDDKYPEIVAVNIDGIINEMNTVPTSPGDKSNFSCK